MDRRLLGGMTPAEFLARHWQKKPLLVRGAFPGFRDPVTPDELAGLALEDDVESRLVFERGGKRPWQLERGPFPEAKLRALPRSHWTLLVQGVDKWVPEAARILDRFAFIPGWRLDDLMVSFAPDQGSVGPHIDSYDVFLIQGLGRRRWQIDARPDPAMVPGLDLKILKRFDVQEEWILEPGDMLYVPPGVAHYGVALEECLTYSVGFRAPAHRALVEDLFNLPPEVLATVDTEALYADPDLTPARNAGELDAASLARVRAILEAPLRDDETLARWLGRFATSVPGREPGRRVSKTAAQAALAKGRALQRAGGSRLAFHEAGKGRARRLYLFVDGEEIALTPALAPLVRLLCDAREIPAAAVLKAVSAAKDAGDEALALVAALLTRGAFVLLRAAR